MASSLTHKIITKHLVEGRMNPGEEVAIRMDQTLLQDATGTLAWLEFEAMGVDRVRVRQATQYVDHNILQTGFENADDHLFLQGMCGRYGAVFSRAGNGISHWSHLERFDVPGQTMLGCDSHTCQAGAAGMLAIGAGGFEVAAVMAGEPYRFRMPEVVRVDLTGTLPPWTSAKDVILSLLQRFGEKWGKEKVLEYGGSGLKAFTLPERGTIANMGAELGATGSIFPSDGMTERFFRAQGRLKDWRALRPDEGAAYDDRVDVDLTELEPLIACPSSPGNVKPVSEVAGTEVTQVAIGSSVNSSYRDLAVVAEILDGKKVHPGLSMAVSPGSRQVLMACLLGGVMTKLIRAGVRELEVACGPCIGMGFAPSTHGASVRTFNRNFPGRSGTPDDKIYLCSPETAAATSLKGVISDPRTLGKPPKVREPTSYPVDDSGYAFPPRRGSKVPILRGPNIQPVPVPPDLPDVVEGEVLIRLGDNISTDHILPGGAEVLPLRSNVPEISKHTFEYVDPTFAQRAVQKGGGLIVGGENYGQGSSREHAAAAPMFLGVRLVVAKSFARMHRDNLVNFGLPPLVFAKPRDYDTIAVGDWIRVAGLREGLRNGRPVQAVNGSKGNSFGLGYDLSPRQREILLAGGGIRYLRDRRARSSVR
ncbi:MAG TPA: aconitate hydratase [Thermoplasmata archaeon]|nr:aconitate hydratase [Thermoplasmata archaeon]